MQNPIDGGSYTRCPVTDELTLVEPTTAPNPGKAAHAVATEAAPAAPSEETRVTTGRLGRRARAESNDAPQAQE